MRERAEEVKVAIGNIGVVVEDNFGDGAGVVGEDVGGELEEAFGDGLLRVGAFDGQEDEEPKIMPTHFHQHRASERRNGFNVLAADGKPLNDFNVFARSDTQLKLGVNERGLGAGIVSCAEAA